MDIENGQREYEVEMNSNGHSKDVTIGSDGHLIEIEEAVALDSLPLQVAAGLRGRAGRGKIAKVESITKEGRIVAYEAQVRTAGGYSEIQVGPDGQPLAREQ
jgi:hypothetical protein